jgi:hypothetical protein
VAVIFALLAQAMAGPHLPAPPRPRSDAPCPVGEAGDVVVCARNQDAYRLKPLPPRADEPALPKAEFGLGAARVAAETEQAQLAGGAQSKRLMIRWKLPLGRKAKR